MPQRHDCYGGSPVATATPLLQDHAMLAILSITIPIYLSIALGYGTTRLGLFGKAEMRTLGKFVINLALPALLFNALASRPIADLVHPGYLVAYAAGSLLTLGLAIAWFRRSGQGMTANAIMAMGTSCSNSGYVGYPVMLLTFAPLAGVVLALNMLVENILIIPLLLALAEHGRSPSASVGRLMRDSLLRLFKNPMVVAVLLGLAFSLAGLQLPTPVARAVNMFSQASGAIALFVIGGNLVQLPLRGMAARVLPIAAGKLLLHPALVALCLAGWAWLGLAPVEPDLRHAAILSAAMPMMGIYTVLAQNYKLEETASAALLSTTLLSFASVNLLLWLLLGG